MKTISLQILEIVLRHFCHRLCSFHPEKFSFSGISFLTGQGTQGFHRQVVVLSLADADLVRLPHALHPPRVPLPQVPRHEDDPAVDDVQDDDHHGHNQTLWK